MTDDAPSAPAPEPATEAEIEDGRSTGAGRPAAPLPTAGPTPIPRRASSADVSDRRPEYRGAELDAARGPGLGCFWFQLIVLGAFIVLIPVGLELNWPFELLAILLFVVIGLLLFVGQTLVFLLRLVAAERGQGRHRPLASGTKTVGELEDVRLARETTAAGEAPRTAGLDLDAAERLLVDAALARAAGALRHQATFGAFALVLRAGAQAVEPAEPAGRTDAGSLDELLARVRDALAGEPAARAGTCRDARLADPSGVIDAIVVNVESPGREPRGVAVPYRRHGEAVELLDARPVPGEWLLLDPPPPAPDPVRQ